MFDFGIANSAQQEAIITTDGPMLIIAGPGTGKTFTLVQRISYLIKEKSVLPKQILIATFTEKAAKELITRISSVLLENEIDINLNEMYIGTFHSICLRILKEHLEYTDLKKNFRLLDGFEQDYLIYQNIYSFKTIPNIDLILERGSLWSQSVALASLINSTTEELVNINDLLQDNELKMRAVGEVLLKYNEMLAKENLLDFSTIQTKVYKLITENNKVLTEIQDQIKYVMIDEYQDTNYVQEQLVMLLSKTHQNVCVVGDDDQGLYRFRGATIRNIIEFPSNFENKKCKIVSLNTNYRSNPSIVDFYNQWMLTTSGQKFKFDWDKYRLKKTIIPGRSKTTRSPAVVKLSAIGTDEWHKKILAFINDLQTSGQISDLNQIAFLFSSVKNERATALADYLEKNGINVYSPRSNMFFKRTEIKLIIGCLLVMFPKYVSKMEAGVFSFLSKDVLSYYMSCVRETSDFLKENTNEKMKRFVVSRGKEHAGLTGNTDYAYVALIYNLLQFEPFRSIIETNVEDNAVAVRPLRNLALVTRIIGKFEYLHQISVLSEKYIDKNTELLFNNYLSLLLEEGMDEYEDDSEYAPSGCVSFMTIHQSKGMEFPVVFVDSLYSIPRKNYSNLMVEMAERFFHRSVFEPFEDTKFFDFWRLYYTAFSRAQDLLILTTNEDSRSPSLYFRDCFNNLVSYDNPAFDISEFSFNTVKDVFLKKSFSFTSHIIVYERCALQYKFFKELDFLPIRASSTLFGQLVHQTIEDVHKAVLRDEIKEINYDNITRWFESNYESLSKSEHQFLAAPQKDIALKHVLRYVEKQSGKWNQIKQAEVDVTLIKPEYIIEGKIDLIKGEDNTVEIVDFKTERKPDIFNNADLLEKYRRQLHLYAYLVEERTGEKVSKMNLYFTGEENSVPTISFPYTRTAIEATMATIDDAVHSILKHDYSRCTTDEKKCKECDFRYYCMNKN